MVNDTIQAVAQLVDDERLGAMITVIEGPDVGAAIVLDRSRGHVAGDAAAWFSDMVATDANDLMDREESKVVSYDDRRIFIDTIAPSPVMVIIGAGHVAQPLSLFATEAGFRVIVADARAVWATPERFPHVDELIVGWPDAVFDRIAVDERTYVVLLSHDSRFEIPAFKAVHGKPFRYLGAMGSRRTHGQRVERLSAEGWSDDEIAAIHGPIGIDLNEKTPAETAVAILAEVIQARYQATS